MQDPLVHHGRHFGRAIHAFCSVQTLLTNGIVMMSDLDGRELETFPERCVPSFLPVLLVTDMFLSPSERKEFTVFLELLKLIPSLENRLMSSDDEEVITIADLVSQSP